MLYSCCKRDTGSSAYLMRIVLLLKFERTLILNFKPAIVSPPNVARLGEVRVLDDFRRHPGVRSGGARVRRVRDLARHPEVGDLQRLAVKLVVDYWFHD